MADLSNGKDGGDSIDTSVDGIRKTVEGALASDEGDEEDADDEDDDDDDPDKDGSGDDAGKSDDDDPSDDSDDAEDEEDEDGKPVDKKDPKSGRKYSQFKGDGSDKAYIGNLEEGYKNSSAEAIRLKGELDQSTGKLDSLLRVVANNPELSAALNKALGEDKGSGSNNKSSDDDENFDLSNPFVKNLQTEWQEKSEKEIQDFIDANPEVETDPQIKADVQHYMRLFSTDYHEKTGKLMSGGEAMAKAYKYLGLEDKRGKQELAAGAKKNLTPPRSRGNKAKKSGGQSPQFTADQIAMAKAMGRDEAWLQKNAS